MKISALIKGTVFAVLVALSASGCNNKPLQLVDIDPFSLGANYRNMRIKGMGFSGEQFTEYEHYNEEEESYSYKYVIEDVRALVVPVDFKDYRSSAFGTEEHSRAMIDKVMFADEDDEDLEWYSLSAYYKSSSFGQCNVTGSVAPWWHYNGYAEDIEEDNTDLSDEIALDIQNYYRSHPEEINLADYDANKDGLVDSLIMVYTAPITTTGEVWWAYCSSISGAYGKYTPDGKMEGVNRYFWASIKFLFETEDGYWDDEDIADGTAIPDAHTMTHEYGHVLSLPDYYITDYNKSDYSGLGGLDMMDYNIGDHNAFSKMLYGWINPRRVEGTSGKITVTLRSTTTTGDTIIIPAPNDWNNTYMDQYLVVEFLTPDGVAKKDGQAAVPGRSLYYSKAGIRITHVDARMGAWSQSGSFRGFTYTTSMGSDYWVYSACSNTASDSCYKDYKLIELLSATGKTQKQLKGTSASNKDLYYEGGKFGYGGIHNGFKFNGIDGTKTKTFGFKIHVDKINGKESATITISR